LEGKSQKENPAKTPLRTLNQGVVENKSECPSMDSQKKAEKESLCGMNEIRKENSPKFKIKKAGKGFTSDGKQSGTIKHVRGNVQVNWVKRKNRLVK